MNWATLKEVCSKITKRLKVKNLKEQDFVYQKKCRKLIVNHIYSKSFVFFSQKIGKIR